MNLYATTTSERATKGQGGNEYLEIAVKGEDQKVFLEIIVTHDANEYHVRGYAISPQQSTGRRSEQYIAYDIQKGEKKKDECEHRYPNGRSSDGKIYCVKCDKTK